ncbi:MAG: AMP-dependent synthetase, partial [Pseudonocardiales bacterium]|nr:AMP-dependent synthetase [Pseudonocardiales bacterium]
EAIATRYAAGLLGCATAVGPGVASPVRLGDFVHFVGAEVLVCFPSTRARAEVVHAAGNVNALLSMDVENELLLRSARDDPKIAAVGPDDLASFISSGGTTGRSKASYRTFTQWLATVDTGPCPNRRQLICTSLAHISQVHVDQTLLGGGTVVLLDRFDAGGVLRTIEDERITHLCLVEPMLVELADHPDVERRDLSSLIALSHIGANAAPSLRRRLLGRLGPRLVHPYGASEAGIISLLDPAHYRLSEPDRLGTSGRVMPGVELRIEGIDGTCVDPGEEGLIVVRSAGVAGGYAGDIDQSAFRPHGWYVTGDLGRLDNDGYLHVHGRLKDRRVVHGIALLPLDVQEALCAHPDVRYAVVIPKITPANGFDAIVLLQPESRLTMDELRTHVATRYGSHLVPGLLAVVRRVPVTEQGKPDRLKIRRFLRTQANNYDPS